MTTAYLSRGAWICFHCEELLPRSSPTCCGPVPRLVWDDSALDLEVEVSGSYSKPQPERRDRGGGCISPPEYGGWDDVCAEVDGKPFALWADEEGVATDALADDDSGTYDPREDERESA